MSLVRKYRFWVCMGKQVFEPCLLSGHVEMKHVQKRGESSILAPVFLTQRLNQGAFKPQVQRG